MLLIRKMQKANVTFFEYDQILLAILPFVNFSCSVCE